MYESKREGGKVVSRCVGPLDDITRLLAEMAELDAYDRREKAEERRREEEAWRSRTLAVETPIRELFERTEQAALVAAGFHRPNRAPWRRKRTMNKRVIVIPNDVKPMSGDPANIAAYMIATDLAEMVGGDAAPGEHGAAAYIDEVLEALAEDVAASAGPKPSYLRKLAAERLAYCSLDADRWNFKCERAMLAKEEDSRVNFLDRCRTRAHARYQAALKGLLVIKRIERPEVQPDVPTAPHVNGKPHDLMAELFPSRRNGTPAPACHAM